LASAAVGRNVASIIGMETAMTPQPTKRGASEPLRRPLDPTVLSDPIEVLYRAAWALCGSGQQAEDLVQATFARVPKRPRLLRSDDDVGYPLRALGATHVSRHRAAMRRPSPVPLLETDSHDQAEVAAVRRPSTGRAGERIEVGGLEVSIRFPTLAGGVGSSRG
jgi:DNA-directed RNA polymerase specialized sigma24 family protein